jgi:hypothetical protein
MKVVRHQLCQKVLKTVKHAHAYMYPLLIMWQRGYASQCVDVFPCQSDSVALFLLSYVSLADVPSVAVISHTSDLLPSSSVVWTTEKVLMGLKVN